MKLRSTVVALALMAGLTGSAAEPETPAPWMSGHYGVMAFWLYPHFREGDARAYVDEPVEAFDLSGFMRDFDETGADWLFFTLGQSTGAYASPNDELTAFCGPGHVPTRRDLVKEIGAELKRRGKRLIVYLPCDMLEPGLRKRFRWSFDDKENAFFQTNWTRIVSAWSKNYGRVCDGWFFDGATLERFVPGKLHTELWRTAARTGNPDAVVGYNSGMMKISWDGSTNNMTCVYGSDFQSGEVNFVQDGCAVLRRWKEGPDVPRNLWKPEGPYARGSQHIAHAHFPIDGYWNAWATFGPWCGATPELRKRRPELFDKKKMEALREKGVFPDPIYSPAELEAVVRNFTDVGAALTINVGVNEKGRMNPKSVRLFRAFRNVNAR